MADTGDDRDQILVRQVQRGDPDAFDGLVRRHQAGVYNLVRSMVGPNADAEDLAQEVFVRAHRSLGRFRGDSSVRTWLFAVAINLSRSYRTARHRRQGIWVDSGEGTEASVIDRHPDAADVERSYMRRQLIQRALDALPLELREAVVLRDLHGMDYREIADMLEVPNGTVESRIFRARRRLRPMLGALLGRAAEAGR